jgi:hypothetical protein
MIAFREEESLKNFEDRKFIHGIDHQFNPNTIRRNYITRNIFIAWVLNLILVHIGLFCFLFLKTHYFYIFAMIYLILMNFRYKKIKYPQHLFKFAYNHMVRKLFVFNNQLSFFLNFFQWKNIYSLSIYGSVIMKKIMDCILAIN